MSFNQIIGIVLSSINSQETGKIITLFSPEGIYKFYINKKKLSSLCLATQLTLVHYTFIKKNIDKLQSFCEGFVLDAFIVLRENLEYIETSNFLIKTITLSQQIGQKAPLLYQLFANCLKKMPDLSDPYILQEFFLIKLMKHDGYLSDNFHLPSCCDNAVSKQYIFAGECFCERHKPIGSILMSKIDLEKLNKMYHLTNFNDLKTEENNKMFLNKIFKIFEQCLN